MNCKTCNIQLKATDKFCNQCGAKIVENKLSLKGTWQEFVGPFFSWDNNFWKTFKDMFFCPQLVLSAYINGARKKYFHPFSFLIVFTTIAIFFYKFYPISFYQDIAQGFDDGMQQNSVASENKSQLNMKGIYQMMFDYYNFFMVLMIPYISLMSYWVFKKRKNNWAEHMVFQSYLQTIIGYFSIVLQIFLLQMFDLGISNYFIVYFIFVIIYSSYVFKKLYHLNVKELIITNLKFWFFSIITYIVLIVILSLLMVMYKLI